MRLLRILVIFYRYPLYYFKPKMDIKLIEYNPFWTQNKFLQIKHVFKLSHMSYNKNSRASDIEISSQLTGNTNIDTPQKVNISALKLRIIKKEKKESLKNRTFILTIFIILGTIGYFVSN